MNQYKRMVNRLRRELGKVGSAEDRDNKLREIRHVVLASQIELKHNKSMNQLIEDLFN